MENTKTLLMMVLKQHFRDRSNILDEALHVIKDYSNKESTQNEYEEILQTLREKMNDLPSYILLYFLSMVPLPKYCSEGYESSLFKEMMKCEVETFDYIRPKLVEYLNNDVPPLIPIKKDHVKLETVSDIDNVPAEEKFVQPRKIVHARRKNARNTPKECKSLLDLCAEEVVKNKTMLNQFYKHKKEKAWCLVNSGKCDTEKLYEVIKDVNKKAKLIRMIDGEDISRDFMYEEYGNSDIFLKENHLYEAVYEDPFELSKQLQDAIVKFVCK